MNLATEYPSRPMPASAGILNRWLRIYIYYSTLIFVFSLVANGRGPGISLGLGIRQIELNILLVCLLVRFTRIDRWILCFLVYLTASSIVGVATGKAAFPVAFIEYRAVVISVLYYYYFFKLIKFDSDRAFATYAKLAFWFAVIALPYWAGSCIATHALQRLRGFATEPAQFCLLVLPAYYWYAYKFRTTRKHALEVGVFTLTVALSESTLGYVCAAIGALILLSGNRRHMFAHSQTITVNYPAAPLSIA